MIGVGNEYRGDDAAGLEVVRRLRGLDRTVDVREHQGDALGLLDALAAWPAAVLVDAIRARSGAPVGEISCFEANREPLPEEWSAAASTHALGLGAAVALGRRLGSLPHPLVVYGITGAAFAVGQAPSHGVAAAIPALADRVRRHAWLLSRTRNQVA